MYLFYLARSIITTKRKGEREKKRRRQRKKEKMAKDWAPLQDEIRELYCVEKKSLNEVMCLVERRHGFHAS